MQGLCIHLVTIVTKWELFVVIYSELREKMETCEILTSQWREKVETLSLEVDDLVQMVLGNEAIISEIESKALDLRGMESDISNCETRFTN